VTPEGVNVCLVSPDGKYLAAEHSGGDDGRLYPVAGGEPKPIPGLLGSEVFSWSSDPKFLYVNQRQQLPIRIYRLNIETGQRQFFKEVTPIDVTGICDLHNVHFSADGRGYIYGYVRLLSDLYLVKGLH
jgi:WD40 repeat protein